MLLSEVINSMESHDAVLIALLVILVVVVMYYGSNKKKHHSHCDNFTHHPMYSSGLSHKHNSTPVAYVAPRREKYSRSNEHFDPERVAEAEHAQWVGVSNINKSSEFNTELSNDPQSDTMQYHTPQPTIDYGQYINDLVVDDRTKNNHKKFTKGLGNFTGTAMTVDNLDEAMEASVHFTGLRRPQSVKQRNPLQLTEHDEGTYKKNPKFKFNHTD